MVDIPTLKTILAGEHPTTGPYSADAYEAADQGNLVNCEEDVESISGQELFEAVVPADYAGLSAEHKSLLHALIGMGTIWVIGSNTRDALVAMFTGTPTLTALGELQKRAVSHFQKEGLGFIYPGHIENARM